nr:achaete-scute homolog 5 [Macaca nemestrina]
MNNNFCRALVDRRPLGPPSCMQLGVVPPPRQAPLPPAEPLGNVPFLLYPGPAEQPYYDAYAGVFPYVPFPGAFGVYEYPFEPAFIQKRNERERQRVKCVNEGYARLRGHLPGALAEKRLSKVETLRWMPVQGGGPAGLRRCRRSGRGGGGAAAWCPGGRGRRGRARWAGP